MAIPICGRCGKEMPDRVHWTRWCRPCLLERRREYFRQRYRNDPTYRDRLKARSKAKRAGPENRAKRRERYANDPEYRAKRLAQNRKWQKANPPSRGTYNLRKHLPELLERCGWRCGICGQPLPQTISPEIHVDHIQPVSELAKLGSLGVGAMHDLENLQPTHAYCNQSKGSKPPS